MNHQPFENWLLDDEPLSIPQQRELQIHLRTCTTCTAIADSNLALHTSRTISPAPGFTDRFRPRLAEWRKEQLRRQALGTIVLVLAGLVTLYSLAGPAMLEAVRSPAEWLRGITMYVVAVVTFASVLGHVGGILLRNLPEMIPPAAWLAIPIAGLAAGVLWIATMRRLAGASRGA